MKTFKNYTQVLKYTDQQTTAQQLFNGRMNIKGKGWESIKITPEFKSLLASEISNRLGGQAKTKERVYTALMRNRPPQHWTLDRFTIEQYDNTPMLDYCPGQYQSHDMKQGRNYLKNI